MTEMKTRSQGPRVRRLGTAAAWVAAVSCLPYLIIKLLWTFDISLGITDQSVLDSPGWMAGNALMALIQLAALALIVTLTRPWAHRVPAWLLLFPAWVGTGLLFQVVVGVLIGVFASGGSSLSTGAFQPWVFAVVYASFAVEGAALAVAFACYVQGRWGQLLSERTAEVLARGRLGARSWPEAHIAGMAEAVAAMAVAVAVVFGYWAAGGSLGLSDAAPQAGWVLQASGAAWAVIAAVGLLGLAGRWGHQTRFWLPVALTWIGSGALAAFDGLMLTLNRLLMFGAAASEPGWSVTDTVLLTKVLVGLLAAAVGVLAVRAAIREPAAT